MKSSIFIIPLIIISSIFCQLFAQQIIMSSRLFHPVNDKDTLSTMNAIRLFRPDRLEWMYCTNPKQLQQIKDLEIPFSLATHPQIPDSLSFTTPKYRILDVHGNPVIAPWMRGKVMRNPYWGCVNNPGFQQLFLDYAENLIDIGAYAIFVDDALFNAHAVNFGGCFCDYCMTGFSQYLISKGIKIESNFNYRKEIVADEKQAKEKYEKLFRQYLQESVILFYNNWMEHIRKYAHNNVKFLLNNYQGKWSDIYRLFDGGICEIEEKDIDYSLIDKTIDTAKKLGKDQKFDFETDNKNLLYGVILYSYINGSEALLPWDLWIQGKSTGTTSFRYYGTKEEYTELLFLLRNVLLNKAYKKNLTGIETFKKYGLNKDKFICYSYCSKSDTYTFIFNLDYRNNPNFSANIDKIKPNQWNNTIKKHYTVFKKTPDRPGGVVTSAFMVIKE